MRIAQRIAMPQVKSVFRTSGMLTRTDLINLASITSAFILVALLVPPVRSYPIGDDWDYVLAVEDLLKWDYKPHEWAQAIGLGHFAWGALVATASQLSALPALLWAWSAHLLSIAC
jgi:hypothetical protein